MEILRSSTLSHGIATATITTTIIVVVIVTNSQTIARINAFSVIGRTLSEASPPFINYFFSALTLGAQTTKIGSISDTRVLTFKEG